MTDLLTVHAATAPDKTAIIDDRGDGDVRTRTWADLEARANQLAHVLVDLGVNAGQKVVWCGQNSVGVVEMINAGRKVGAVSVPLNYRLSDEEAAYVVDHCDAEVVCVDAEFAPMFERIRDAIPTVREILVFDGVVPAGMLDCDRLVGAAPTDPPPAPEVAAGVGSTMIYTSGTTGPPKGVVILHSNVAFDVTATRSVCSFPKGDIMLLFLPLAHVLGRFEHFLSFDAMAVTAFARGVQTVAEDLPAVRPHIMVSVPRLYEKFYGAVLAKVHEEGGLKKRIFLWALSVGREVSIRKQRNEPVTGWLSVKFSLADRLVFGKIRGRLGGRLRFFVSGGAPLAREIAEFFHAMGILILEGYGLTETPSVVSAQSMDQFKFGTVGKPLPGTEVRIASDGEILIRGPHVFKEYYRNPEATREAIDPEGWFHSGDIGTLDADGFLRITDRKKDIIVTSGGKNVAPQNVENVLKNDKFVSQAFVYGDRRKYLTALITLSGEDIVKWAEQNDIPERDLVLLARNPRVEAMMRSRVDEINRQLATFEQVKKFVLLGADFTQETGELTPTLKVKRKVVIRKYGNLLDALYEKD